jgi:hypothetical protein
VRVRYESSTRKAVGIIMPCLEKLSIVSDIVSAVWLCVNATAATVMGPSGVAAAIVVETFRFGRVLWFLEPREVAVVSMASAFGRLERSEC